MSERFVRSRARIDVMVVAAIEFAQKYPNISINSIAVALNWTQSSLGRALESRELAMPARVEPKQSVNDLIATAAMRDDDYQSLAQIKADLQILLDSTTVEIEESEPTEDSTPEAEAEDEAEVEDESEEAEDYEDDSEEF